MLKTFDKIRNITHGKIRKIDLFADVKEERRKTQDKKGGKNKQTRKRGSDGVKRKGKVMGD